MLLASAPAAPPSVAFPARRVYAVVGVPPEIQAYAMAKYSRSSQGMLESIRELSQQQAAQFLDTFYFQYGHRSIADLAHLVFGIEQVSILAAIAVVDEQVWDGQERSTRYQPFRATGWYTPPELAGTDAERTYRQAAAELFAAYEQLSARLLAHLVEAVPRPAEMAEGAYRRTLRARAFDVARALLPLATHTSVGQVVSARVLERQVSRLLSADQPELRAIGEELKAACSAPAEAPLAARAGAQAAEHAPGDGGERARSAPGDGGEQAPAGAAPTLVKYASASTYLRRSAQELEQAARVYLGGLEAVDRSTEVELAEAAPPLVELVATLLYRHDRQGHSYRQVLEVVRELSSAQRQEVLDLSVRHRGRHDDLLREHQAGYPLTFDVLVDLGAYRDLHRHRRCVQVRQPYTWRHGSTSAEEIFRLGLGEHAAEASLAEGLGQQYESALAAAQHAAREVRPTSPLAADYLLPLAYRVRSLFKMDWAQAAYMVEQRTTPAGHFAYRRIAWGMYTALRARDPALASPIRAVDPAEPFDLLQR